LIRERVDIPCRRGPRLLCGTGAPEVPNVHEPSRNSSKAPDDGDFMRLPRDYVILNMGPVARYSAPSRQSWLAISAMGCAAPPVLVSTPLGSPRAVCRRERPYVTLYSSSSLAILPEGTTAVATWVQPTNILHVENVKCRLIRLCTVLWPAWPQRTLTCNE
jgi:hypothetical protein